MSDNFKIVKSNRHIILRKDILSNQMFPKQELIRIVKNKENEVFIDSTGKKNGRGVYMRPRLEDLEKLKRTRNLEKNLRTKVAEGFYDLIAEEIKNNWS